MTREEAKRRAELYSAFAEGKIIQFKTTHDEWVDLKPELICGFSESFRYRIKPEPKYRPFKTKEECWNEMLKHQPFGWVKSKHNGNYSNISTMYRSCAEERIMVANSSYTLAQALKIFTFTDDIPFGIKEE